ncbi:uncharacterized protein LOC100839640 [Brachypodium distachyon]|uniref:BSD domain-containing protein n=1 Tax=Brachypodium distachyon TaxID=15368 RepID=I1IL33_BRADI|nr:uncharacterized protein LOC100839640 [Brachypodium distachyon]KQJ88201.1 hypothetical protein BRADI_4g16327v3 [Brachypodium distachyon]|eukprot:XP_003577458.1 uncharacterized protein LOC100839640 [Brachypodium distachyon]
MSWFARSIANSLLSPDEPDADGEDPRPSASPTPGSPPRGVREDLSELTDALAHRFQGLASFLAPPAPGGGGSPRAPNPAEIAGRFRAGLARLPGRQAVADLAKIASSLLPPDEGWGEADAAGVTEDVVAFARDAAMRPELWLDFPLLADDAYSDDFDMTDAQQDHALAVESMAPELADLRIELCPSHMSEACFWMIYFVLLHSKLTKEDAELLSTPQILEAREKLSEDLRYQEKLESNEDTVDVPFSSAEGTVPKLAEVVGVLKDQDALVRATSFSNIDLGIRQPADLKVLAKDTVSIAGAVTSDNISGSVPVQLVPVFTVATECSESRMDESIHAFCTEDATEFSKSRIEESTPDFTTEVAVANDQTVTSIDSSPLMKDQRKQPSNDLGQSRVVVQKTYNDDSEGDGDEWLEEETGGPGNMHIPIAHDDEDVSFSDLEEDDDAA